MACFHPQNAKKLKSSGKAVFIKGEFSANQDIISGAATPLLLKCGQCIGCRLDKSREWAIRCVHEASLHEQNSYLTLTYNDENLPGPYTDIHGNNYPAASLKKKTYKISSNDIEKNTRYAIIMLASTAILSAVLIIIY